MIDLRIVGFSFDPILLSSDSKSDYQLSVTQSKQYKVNLAIAFSCDAVITDDNYFIKIQPSKSSEVLYIPSAESSTTSFSSFPQAN